MAPFMEASGDSSPPLNGNVFGEVPAMPVSVNGNGSHHDPSSELDGDRTDPIAVPVKGGYFIQEDLSAFDAGFFSLSPAEAASVDPMQRWLLETAFRALENAGMPMDSVSGTSTSVFTGCFGSDYTLQLYRDSESLPTYGATGIGLSMLSNRISWFFNFRGPSITMDSACSSSMMALDVACQSLRSGSSSMSLVTGSNLTFAPEVFTALTNASFLSPDGRCYSFDHRGNGYARGEGIAVVVLKRLSDAIRDGNTIRAVIRSSCSNEDGRTPGITQPSSKAQEELIIETYRREGLSMAHTRYVEAHGTGTAIGDPTEAKAIGSAFRAYRSSSDRTYIGAVKSNIGHLEGASGLAGLIKAILVLEKGIIPPNANFEKLNHQIDSDHLRLSFPSESVVWPTPGLRRASVNSFGYGGANSHAVLDDAYNYLRLRGLAGKHCTTINPSCTISSAVHPTVNGNQALDGDKLLRLYVFSSADKDGLMRIADSFQAHISANISGISKDESFMRNLAYTLDSHRSKLSWRAFALLRSPEDLQDLSHRLSIPRQASTESLKTAFIFTGQGAQWFAMGRELMRYAPYRLELSNAGKFLRSLGCNWSVTEELMRTEESSGIDNTELSQALTTVVQIALVNLVRKFGIRPAATVGHSSGEIAAAYAGGYISAESAWKLAYFRGICAAEASHILGSGSRGAMMSVGLSEDDARHALRSLEQDIRTNAFGITVACINSPANVTLAGEEHLIDAFKARLGEEVFARKLRVNVAYHSTQMEAAATKLKTMIGTLDENLEFERVPMFSTVTGERAIGRALLDPSYWALNMVSPVRFTLAIEKMCASLALHYFVEVGPHGALQGPIRDMLKIVERGNSFGYDSLLKRNASAHETLLQALGNLHSMGFNLDIRAANELLDGPDETSSLLVDLPEYPFDHSQHYWHEGRLSKNYRLRTHAPSELLGVRARDWDPKQPTWNHCIRTTEMPWTEQHVINGTCLYPASGMLAMAIEGVKQIAHFPNLISGFILRDVEFGAPIDLTASKGESEVRTSMKAIEGRDTYTFAISTHVGNNEWVTNCSGCIATESSEDPNKWTRKKTLARRKQVAETFALIRSNCTHAVNPSHMYSLLKQHGLEYGPHFQAAKKQLCNPEKKEASADIALFRETDEQHVIHPVSLDAVFHLVFTALTAGGTKALATSVPFHIGSLWISSKGLNGFEREDVGACAAVTQTTSRGFFCRGAALDKTSDSEELRLWFDEVELRNVSGDVLASGALSEAEPWCMHVDCKPALSKLSSEEICNLLEKMHPASANPNQFFNGIELMISKALKTLLSVVNIDESDEKYAVGSAESGDSLETVCERVRSKSHWERLYAEIALNLVDMFKGGNSPLEMILETDHFKQYYEEVANYRSAQMASSYIDLLAHQNPGMNILEVGGGTGSGARTIIKGLSATRDGSRPATLLRCNRYDFTDISPAFMDTARREFERFESQMTFQTLDIEQDFTDQGFEKGSYDVVLAISTLHITKNLLQTLRNVRKALKTDGKLIIQESFEPSGWTLGFVFGLFPGWWAGINDGRTLSPNIDVETWDKMLKQCGYSGAEMVFRDVEGNQAHRHGWIVATAVELEAKTTAASKLQSLKRSVIVIDETSKQQQALADTLKTPLQSLFGSSPTIMNITEAASRNSSESELILFLPDYGLPFLESLDETQWVSVQGLVRSSYHLLWVSSAGGKNAHPSSGLIDGLSRTLRLENYHLHLVTLGLDLGNPQTDKVAYLMQIVTEMGSRAMSQPYEQDYFEIDGVLYTQRLVEAQFVSKMMATQVLSYQTRTTAWSPDVRFEVLGIQSDTEHIPLFFQIPEPLQPVLKEDQVEVVVRAVTLQSTDAAYALGCDEDAHFGRYCSGVVSSVGPKASFSVGDHVFAVCSGSLRSHIQVSSTKLVGLPASQSFPEACWAIPPTIEAYHSLVETGALGSSGSILLHGTIGAISQGILAVLSRRAYDIWTTAADEQEAVWISSKLGIQDDRIVPTDWLKTEPMIASQWKTKFDVVFSVDEATMPRLLSGCMKPGGKCIILRREVTAKTSQMLGFIPSGGSLAVVDHADIQVRPENLQEVAELSMSLVESRRETVAVFGGTELPKAFKQLRREPHRDVVISFEESDRINISKKPRSAVELDPHATYIIAGAFGGIGRATASWMVTRGARHLIMLSRSGPKTPETLKLLNDLRGNGCQIEALCCDVTNRTELRSVLDICSVKMPAVKGCILAAVVMAEAIFEKMTFQEWKSSVDPKAAAAWNLHAELPDGLDFFLMTSSAMGWLGYESLSGYNAGNTYQEALARYRISQGQHGVSLNLGGILDSGYLTEHQQRMDVISTDPKLYMMTMKQVCSLLDIYCDHNNTRLLQDADTCQPIFGIQPPAYFKARAEVPHTMTQPLWGHMHFLPSAQKSIDERGETGSRRKRARDTVSRLAETKTHEEAAVVVSDALVQQVAAIICTPDENINPQETMCKYGIDSLSAIHLRNWITKLFGVEVSVFEILGETNFVAFGAKIAMKMQAKNAS
uniref:Polyketide synthase n=1 Tax=Bionectria ochroleuca TaxID=29856 RepID=A0A2L0P0J9_BIOOC|nr:polyketide synthase [Clonostachys rosea]